MKLKCRPEDFLVEELSDVDKDSGPFALYRLSKRSVGTPEAIDAISKRWRLQREHVSYGGLKDKHAATAQYVTILGGPRRDLTQADIQLTYLGQSDRPFTAQEIQANRFTIVLRDLSIWEATQTREDVGAIESGGFANYFDDQRFGSLGTSGEFIARPWCQGNYERALWLALADLTNHDRAEEKQQKLLLQQNWGDWRHCQELLAPSLRHRVVSFLVHHPDDFRKAIAYIPSDLRGIYLAAFQSFVWNRTLASFLKSRCHHDQLIEVMSDSGALVFLRQLSQEQRDGFCETKIPLPSARSKDSLGPYEVFAQQALHGQGMALREMRVKYPRDSFFSRGNRAAIVVPLNVGCAMAEDELYTGRMRLTLSFDLPRGSYATMLVKWVTQRSQYPTGEK